MQLASKFAFIDALRGCAILGVVLSHCSSNKAVVLIGQHGVQLFFLVSVYTLFISLYSKIKSDKVFDLRRWLIRRCFRVLPLFYIGICFYYIFPLPYMEFWRPDGLNAFVLTSGLTMVFGWHPSSINALLPGSWSLSAEFSFYATIPILFLLIYRANLSASVLVKSLAVASVTTSLLAVLVSKGMRSDPTVFSGYQSSLLWYYYQLWFPLQAPILFYGSFLYYWHLNKKKRFSHPIISGLVALIFGWLIIDADPIDGVAYACLMCAGLFNLYYNFSDNKFLVNHVIVGLGKISFSVYIFHFSIVYHLEGFISRELLHGVPFFLLSLVLSSGIAFFTHKLVEKNFIICGERVLERFNHN